MQRDSWQELVMLVVLIFFTASNASSGRYLLGGLGALVALLFLSRIVVREVRSRKQRGRQATD